MASIYEQLVADNTIYRASQFIEGESDVPIKNLLKRQRIPFRYAKLENNLKLRIKNIFDDFDFKSNNLCIAGGFYSSYSFGSIKDFDIYCFGDLKESLLQLLQHLKPSKVFISVNCITFYHKSNLIQVIYKKEFRAKNAYELVSNFDISACEVWYDGELNFTARAKYAFETGVIFVNQMPVHKLSINRIIKYADLYSLYITDEQFETKIAYGCNIISDNLFKIKEILNDLSQYDNYHVNKFNQNMIISGKYNQLVGILNYDNVIDQINTGIIKYSPFFELIKSNIFPIYSTQDQKILNHEFVEYTDETEKLFKIITEKSIDIFQTIIHKIIL